MQLVHCCLAVAEILQHIAMDVRIGDAQPVTQAPYLALTSDSCTDRSAKKEEVMYLRFAQGNKIDTQFFSLQRPPSPTQTGLRCSAARQNTELCGNDHAPVTRGRMRA